MIYWFSFWACNLNKLRWVTFLCFFYHCFLFHLINTRAISTGVIKICSKILMSLGVSRYEELYQLEVGDRIHSVSCEEGGEVAVMWRGCPLTVKCSCSHLEYWVFVKSVAQPWSVQTHPVCRWDLRIFTTQIDLFYPCASFQTPFLLLLWIGDHGSLKVSFPECFQGNDTFQRGFSS